MSLTEVPFSKTGHSVTQRFNKYVNCFLLSTSKMPRWFPQRSTESSDSGDVQYVHYFAADSEWRTIIINGTEEDKSDLIKRSATDSSLIRGVILYPDSITLRRSASASPSYIWLEVQKEKMKKLARSCSSVFTQERNGFII